jgi:hypothetical protein
LRSLVRFLFGVPNSFLRDLHHSLTRVFSATVAHRDRVTKAAEFRANADECEAAFAARLLTKDGGAAVVINSWDEQIRKCYREALDCAREADAQIDPKIKQDFLNLKRGWLLLARSYERPRGRQQPDF